MFPSFPITPGLILVPNGKLLGKYMGDRYPAEEALAAAKAAAEARGERGSYYYEKDAATGDEKRIYWDGSDGDGPGGRLYGFGQEDEETKLLKKYGEKQVQCVIFQNG